ncbi:interleukin-2 receptor subunit beta isoform X2 [Sceloporus undulatus]|nr:interleukin-2 receptor subunit beta isoform X2 [Sceloporus undulatus]
MMTSPPGLLCILLFLLTSVFGQGSSSLVCLFNSVENLACTWTPIKNATEVPCKITASVNYGKPPKTCQPKGTGSRSCHLILKDYSLTIVDDITLDVSCHSGKKWESVENLTMYPFYNIQLDPPSKVRLENASKHSYSLTWEFSDLSHYLEGKLEYEVQYKINNSDEAARILSIIQDQKWVKFENLSPDTVYEAAVRAKVQKNDGIYKSIWSRWSTPATWRTEPKASPSVLLPVLLVGSLVTIFVITITLLGKSALSKCLKKVLRVQLPNPDEFFPPLNAVHGGDIQKWLSPPTSMASFQLATEGPEVSVLEVIQKDSQGTSPFLLKEYCTNMNTPELSGHSLSSCFTNGGYFFFQHLNSFEIEPCKVYFTYDPLAQESSDSADSCSYKVLHETVDNSQLSPIYSNMATQENSSFLQESKDSSQKGRDVSGAFPSWGTFSKESSMDEEETQDGSKPTVLLLKGPEEFHMGCSILPEKFNSGSNGTKAIQRVDLLTSSIESHSSVFLQSVIQSQDQANVLCRAASPSQLPISSEGYLSLRDLQSHYSHPSV